MNKIANNIWGGIILYLSSNNTITRNVLISNIEYALYQNYCSGNLIYHNNVINNPNEAFDEPTAWCWNNTYPIGGNYWSSYTGVDLNSGPNQDQPGSDGIGDIPYNIPYSSAGSQDRYPLMTPWQTNKTATATGPQGAGHDHVITITYDWTENPTEVDLFYSTNHGDSWNYLGTDDTVDGFYDWTPQSNPCPKPQKFYWIANANGGADDVGVPANGTEPEAGPFNWKTFDVMINHGDETTGSAGVWQFISIPLDVNGDALTVLNDTNWGDGGTDWDYVLWYDPSDTINHWKSYYKDWPPEFNHMPNLDNTMGLWIHVTRNTGDGVLTVGEGFVPGSTAITLRAGWNLVGYPSLCTNMTVANALWGTGADIVEIFDPSATYRTRVASSTYLMRPGEGYWVHVPADTAWTVDW